MKTQTRRLFAALALVAGTFALPAISAEPTVEGKWTLSIHAPDHEFGVGLELKQDGKKVTGTLMMPQGDVALTGEFADGALVLNGTMEGGPGAGPGGPIKLSAKLKEDGTLNGEAAVGRGHRTMMWTAERLRKR